MRATSGDHDHSMSGSKKNQFPSEWEFVIDNNVSSASSVLTNDDQKRKRRNTDDDHVEAHDTTLMPSTKQLRWMCTRKRTPVDLGIHSSERRRRRRGRGKKEGQKDFVANGGHSKRKRKEFLNKAMHS